MSHELIDYLDDDRKAALRQLAAKIGASDDTAMKAWMAWQDIAGLPHAERTQAVGIVLACEEIARKSEGRPALFSGHIK